MSEETGTHLLLPETKKLCGLVLEKYSSRVLGMRETIREMGLDVQATTVPIYHAATILTALDFLRDSRLKSRLDTLWNAEQTAIKERKDAHNRI